MDDRTFDLIMARLDSQDEKLDQLLADHRLLHADHNKLKARASAWGAITGALTAIGFNLFGG